MLTKYFSILAIFILVDGFGYGQYDLLTVDCSELTGNTITGGTYFTISYDFSSLVSEGQVIEKMVFSLIGDYTPAMGYISGEYQTLTSIFAVRDFDNFIFLELQLFEESVPVDYEIDSEKMIGWRLNGHGEPYLGYSGALEGSMDSYLFVNKNPLTVVDTWPTIDVSEAIFTLYLVPEPTCLFLLTVGALFLKKRA